MNGCTRALATMFVSLYSVLLNIRTPGQKLRLGGDALGADPTYLLYLPSRSRGELRRIDFEPDCAGATLSDFAASESTRKPVPHTRGISRA